jgi:hypothetical protein
MKTPLNSRGKKKTKFANFANLDRYMDKKKKKNFLWEEFERKEIKIKSSPNLKAQQMYFSLPKLNPITHRTTSLEAKIETQTCQGWVWDGPG